jgi:antitoxin component YwqK of YwqJK toxin-antitoxin module
LIICLGITLTSNAQKGIDHSINFRKINDVFADTVFYRRQDTIYKVVYKPGINEPQILNLYIKDKGIWHSYYGDGKVCEEGKFAKRKYGLGFVFNKKPKTFVRNGTWKYYNIWGELIEEKKY